MKARNKAVGLLVLGVFGVGVFAAIKKAKAAPAQIKNREPEQERRNEEISPVDDEQEQNISITMPGENGEAGGGPDVIIDDENEPVEEVRAEEPLAQAPEKPVEEIGKDTPEDTSSEAPASTVLEKPAPSPAPIRAVESFSPSAPPAVVQLTSAAAPAVTPTFSPATKSETETALEIVSDVSQGEQPTPLVEQETSEEVDQHGTIRLARLMLTRENVAGWKSDLQEDVKEWQGTTGLTADGLFGINSAARMAEEVGLLPLVRFWPRSISTAQGAKQSLRRKIEPILRELQKELPLSAAHIEGLRASLARETAVTLGQVTPPPQDTMEWVEEITEEIGGEAERQGLEEIATA